LNCDEESKQILETNGETPKDKGFSLKTWKVSEKLKLEANEGKVFSLKVNFTSWDIS